MCGLLLAPWPTLAQRAGSADELARLAAYVDGWERELGSVVADETYVQAVARQPRSDLSRQPLVPPRQSRELRSTFTLIRLDDGPTEWVGFREVFSVDGSAPAQRGPSLEQLLRDPNLSWVERWARVRDLSAAHNLGALARSINVPTFALVALRSSGQPRFSFSPRRDETVDGHAVRVLEFTEVRRPTIVSGLRGRDVPLKGRVWFGAATGRIHRTAIELRDDIVARSDGDGERDRDQELTSKIEVDFAPNEHVGVWVPAEMRERYDNSWGETTTGRASYSAYRRFQTTVRVVRPGR